jgi:hypothetical protein
MTPKLLVQPRYFSRGDRAIGGLIILTAEDGTRGKGSPRNRRLSSWAGLALTSPMPRQRRIAPLAPAAASAPTGKDAPPRRAPPMSLPQGLNRPLLWRGSRSAFAGGPTWRPAARAFMAHAEIVAYQRCHQIGTTNAFATSVAKNATSGTSTAVLRAPTGRIVDTSCRASTEREGRAPRSARARRSAPAAESAPDPAPCSPATARAPAARRAWRALATIARRCRRRTAECSP